MLLNGFLSITIFNKGDQIKFLRLSCLEVPAGHLKEKVLAAVIDARIQKGQGLCQINNMQN
jgi:hypothetical protein